MLIHTQWLLYPAQSLPVTLQGEFTLDGIPVHLWAPLTHSFTFRDN